MLDRILQGFLQHAIEAEGDFLRQVRRDAFRPKLDLHALRGKLFAKARRGLCKTQIFRLGGMQVVRQGLNIPRNEIRPVVWFAESPPSMQAAKREERV